MSRGVEPILSLSKVLAQSIKLVSDLFNDHSWSVIAPLHFLSDCSLVITVLIAIVNTCCFGNLCHSEYHYNLSITKIILVLVVSYYVLENGKSDNI